MAFGRHAKLDQTYHLIELNLQTPGQLFNTLDPSPFHEKDLDSVAEQYIVDSVDELPVNKAVSLVIHLPEKCIIEDMNNQFQNAVQRYFDYRSTEALHQFRRCLRQGRIALLVGLSFLLCCLLLRELVQRYGGGFFYSVLAEGLLITGWVALWHPLDIFLYQWWPLFRRYKLLAKISRMNVKVKPSKSIPSLNG